MTQVGDEHSWWRCARWATLELAWSSPNPTELPPEFPPGANRTQSEANIITGRTTSQLSKGADFVGCAEVPPMSDNKKLKKAIRAQMALTGETYSTARMRILAKNQRQATTTPQTEQLVREFIAAARADPAAAQLRAYLQKLPDRELHKIEALLYAGHDRSKVIELAHELHGSSRQDRIDVIVGNPPMLSYFLSLGVRFAADQGVDLNACLLYTSPSPRDDR